jgi:hypothetical protein
MSRGHFSLKRGVPQTSYQGRNGVLVDRSITPLKSPKIPLGSCHFLRFFLYLLPHHHHPAVVRTDGRSDVIFKKKAANANFYAKTQEESNFEMDVKPFKGKALFNLILYLKRELKNPKKRRL